MSETKLSTHKLRPVANRILKQQKYLQHRITTVNCNK